MADKIVIAGDQILRLPGTTDRIFIVDDFIFRDEGAAVSVVLGGTVTANITEDDIVGGAKTITLTTTGDTWIE